MADPPDYCALAPGHPVHGPYHDTEYGFPVTPVHAEIAALAPPWMRA